jgi:hypothetical protein
VQLIRSEVADVYEDIDDDFVEQTLTKQTTESAAFSTRAKHVLQARWDKETIGFTVLTEKSYGAWKSGPTILVPLFRGLGLGQLLRKAIRQYCASHDAISIYCTCPADRPAVVSYLLAAGMQFQARLRQHLSRKRDELVLAQKLVRNRQPHRHSERVGRKASKAKFSAIRVKSTHPSFESVLRFFVMLMPAWYFLPGSDFLTAIRQSIMARQKGRTAYSAKGRTLHALLDVYGRPAAVALVTEKRSGMGKVNLVSRLSETNQLKRLLSTVMRHYAGCRRLYLTLPADQYPAVQAATSLGFRCEGVLTDPFGTGSDHICLGFVASADSPKKRRQSTRGSQR